MAQLYQETTDREQDLKRDGWDVTSIWECQYNKMKKYDPDLMDFLQDYNLVEPLKPRDAFFGGRTEAIKTHHRVEGEEKLKYVDINSLYPWVQKTQQYPIGHTTILKGDDIDIDNQM